MKIPVGRTIEGAYGFAFSNFLSVLGTAWFPYVALVLFIVGSAVLLVPGIASSLPHETFNPSNVAGLIGLGLLAALAFLVVVSMVNVGILRKALGLHPSPVFFYFSLGAPVWRMIGALFLAGLVIIGVGLLAVALCAVIWSVAGNFLHGPLLYLLGGGAALVAFCTYFYTAVRLTYLLPAVVVAEGEIGLGRAWHLARGSFWRIVVISLVTFLPVLIVYSILSFMINGASTMPNFQAGMTFQQAMQAYFTANHSFGIAGLVLYLAYLIVIAGLSNGAIASAYRAVVSPPETQGMHS
jgi:hypothetical protein